MIAAGEFLEYAEVFGNYYGTARRFLDGAIARGHDLLLDIDVQGAAQLRTKLPDAISIFVLPPSRRELELRLRRRSSAENVNDPGGHPPAARYRLAGDLQLQPLRLYSGE